MDPDSGCEHCPHPFVTANGENIGFVVAPVGA
jgi:hypothetical protein